MCYFYLPKVTNSGISKLGRLLTHLNLEDYRLR